jgi:hypothetical protein
MLDHDPRYGGNHLVAEMVCDDDGHLCEIKRHRVPKKEAALEDKRTPAVRA